MPVTHRTVSGQHGWVYCPPTADQEPVLGAYSQETEICRNILSSRTDEEEEVGVLSAEPRFPCNRKMTALSIWPWVHLLEEGT